LLLKLSQKLPEMPKAKKERFIKEFNFSKEMAETITADKNLG
jgi:Asp-tRNA(Asn)/Glu-tRNA(Gln) amidotransferase B subunit